LFSDYLLIWYYIGMNRGLMMKNKMIAAGLITALISTSAAMASKERHYTGDNYTDTARVTHVQPIYRSVETSRPHRECYQEEVYRPVQSSRHENSALGMIVGGALGGALGHNISRHHRDTATIAGAVIGSAIGHDVSSNKHRNRDRGYSRGYEERCHTVSERHSEERLDGYRVTYRYQGQIFSTRMDHDPGDRIQVRISVSPVDY
jgi:uncharacterized protein YcfJ